jgi:hypothetical protein
MEATKPATRTWGPFSGRHLTIIIVTMMIGVVMVPSTVYAVDTFSNVAVQDPVSGVKASVDATHHLAVAGTVHAIAASPGSPFSFTEDINNSALSRLVGPTTKTINLTAISLGPKDGQTGDGDLFLYVGSQAAGQASCNNTITFTLYHVPGVQSSPVFVQSFPTPLVVPHPATGQKTCLYGYVGTNATWTLNGSGFLT